MQSLAPFDTNANASLSTNPNPDHAAADADTNAVVQPVPAGLNHLQFQKHHVALVVLSTLDVMLTWTILAMGGMEVNAVAARVIETFGHMGMTAYKFLIVAFVIALIEIVGRRRLSTGHKLADVCVAIASFPITVSLTQLVVVPLM